MGALPQPATLKEDVTKTLTKYLKIVAFQQPSALLSESLTTAIQLHCPAAAEVLLEPQQATSALSPRRAAALWKEIQKQPKSLGTPFVCSLAAAFARQEKGDLLELAALPAISWDDLPLLGWLISVALSGLTGRRHLLASVLCEAIKLQRTQHLQLLLSMFGGLWQGVYLLPALAAAATISDSSLIQLLTDAAAPGWGRRFMLRGALEETRSVVVAQQILAANVDVLRPWTGIDLMSALAAAAERGDIEVMKVLLAAGKGNAGWQHVYLRSAMSSAAKKGAVAVVQMLLAAAATPWKPSDIVKVLLAAAKAKQLDVVRLLLERSAEKWACDQLLEPVLLLAQQGQFAMAKLLLAAANAPWQGPQLQPALLAAAKNGLRQTTQSLLNAPGVAWTLQELQPAVKAAVERALKAAVDRVAAAEAVLKQLLAARGSLWTVSELEEGVLEAVRGRAGRVMSLLLSKCKRHPGKSLKDALQQAAQQPQPKELVLILVTGYEWTAADLLPALQIAVQKHMRRNAGVLLSPGVVMWETDILGPLIADAVGVGDGTLLLQLLATTSGPWKAAQVKLLQLLPVSAAATAGGGILGKQQLGLMEQLLAGAAQLRPAGLKRAVHAAVQLKWPAVVQVLLSAPAGVQWQVKDVDQLLMNAIQVGDESSVAAIVAAAAGQWKPHHLKAAVGAAIKGGRLGVVREVLGAAAGQWFEEDLKVEIAGAVRGGRIMLWKVLQAACEG